MYTEHSNQLGEKHEYKYPQSREHKARENLPP